MTPPAPRERLDVWEPPAVEALVALRPTPTRGRTWTRARVLVAVLLTGPVLLALSSALPRGAVPTAPAWTLLAVAAAGVAGTLATYLPGTRPTRASRLGRAASPCSAGALVLVALTWLMAGAATSTAALVPVAVIALGALAQRVLTAASCAPRG